MPKIIATKEDWVLLGYKEFSEKGISGIVIERMASKLGVNKSSFYWYFSTKNAFVQAIISYWELDSTSDIILRVNQESTPIKRFEKLVELSFLKDENFDFFFYLKKYAKSHENIASKINDLDKQRLEFTAAIIEQLGYSASESKIKSNIFYKYLIGYHEMIRYQKQNPSYMTVVVQELKHFIKF